MGKMKSPVFFQYFIEANTDSVALQATAIYKGYINMVFRH